VDIFKLFLNRELREEIVEETKRYTEQFLWSYIVKQVNC
jgi:hypothetical protein